MRNFKSKVIFIIILVNYSNSYGIHKLFSLKSYRETDYKTIPIEKPLPECLATKKGEQNENLFTELEIGNKFDKLIQLINQRNGRGQLVYNRRSFKIIMKVLNCEICELMAWFLLKLRLVMDIREVVILICFEASKFAWDFCSGLFDTLKDVIFYIIEKRPNLTAKYACGVTLLEQNCVKNIKIPQWRVNISPRTRKLKLPKLNSTSKAHSLKIIQVTDPHIDPLYKPYGNADCEYPICARENQGDPSPYSTPAGRWGDYRQSNTPWASMESLLNHLKYEHKNIDFIYFTGDILPHNIWETSQKQVTEMMTKFFSKMNETFGNVPVFPVLGNHDVHPMSLFSPFYVKANEVPTSQWVYDLIAKIWSPWLPRSAIATIGKGGYYTVVVKPGFRIIGLNSNVCLTYNLWVLFDDKNLLRPQLQWLADTLQKAEENGEFVYILSHVPPGDRECFIPWDREFQRIILRYSDIIKGQFNGHTHMEEIRLFTDSKSKTVRNVAFNGGSVTTFIDKNPNYRVYFADPNNYDILDFTTWIYEVNEANKKPDVSPRWFQLYSFKTEFQLKSLIPTDMNYFLQSIEKNERDLFKYLNYKYSNSSSKNVPEFKKSMKNEVVCEIISTEFKRNSQCSKSITIFDL